MTLNRGPSVWTLVIGMLLLNFLIVNVFFPGAPAPVEVPYTLFREQVEAGNVLQVSTRSDVLQGEFTEPLQIGTAETATGLFGSGGPVQVTRFSTVIPAFVDPGLETLLLDHGVEINAESLDTPRNPFLTLLLSFGPTILIIALFIWASRRMMNRAGDMGGALGMGKSKARRFDSEKDRKVTFDDVAGIDEAERELAEIVDFLQQPEKYTRLGGTVPKGVLLVGAPGTGKTLLARAVAGEAGVPFFSMSASEFVEMIVGVGASRVRDLFKQAREAAPSIIFIDELDAIGRARGAQTFSGSHSEQEQALNQILTEMDGFGSHESVVVLAATNRPDVLDPALLRAGRFDRRVTVQAPDRNGREQILKVHVRNVPLADDVDLAAVASTTPGLVGADLRNLVNEAALLAAGKGADAVTMQDFGDALEKIILGPARSLYLKPEDRERVAYHEAGHAILGIVVPGADPVSRVTITPRGQALGVTWQRPEEDRYNYSADYLRGRIIGALGGRAAEEIIYGDRTTGAENDIQQVTRMARGMVMRWGMSDAVGPVALAPSQEGNYLGGESGYGLGGKPFSEQTAHLADTEVKRIVDECWDAAVSLLTEHRSELEALTRALLDRETLDEADVLEVTGLTHL